MRLLKFIRYARGFVCAFPAITIRGSAAGVCIYIPRGRSGGTVYMSARRPRIMNSLCAGNSVEARGEKEGICNIRFWKIYRGFACLWADADVFN